jgi:hypothetical protein
MGFVLEFIADWFWEEFMLRLKRHRPKAFWIIISLLLAVPARNNLSHRATSPLMP